MLDFLSRLFQSLAPLWEMSVTAAYAAAVVIALRLLLKKRAPRQVLCLLWLVVFARLLIPVSLKSPLSIVPDALPGQEQQIHLPNQPSGAGHPVTPTQPHSPAQGITPTQPANDTVTPVTSVADNPTAPSLSVPEGVTPAAPQPEAPASFPWQAALAGVWLAGAAALTLYALFSYLRLRRRLFDAIRAGDGAWEHPAVNSPFILGFIRPRIYLPAGLAGRPRQFILCHERAHLRRLDHIVKPVCWAALALHWFNPVVWLAFILMSRDIEAACDEAVIRRLGSEVKADYSATLLALATNRRVPAPCPLAFDEGNAKGRIKNVLRYRRPALWIVVVSVLAAVLAAVCLLTDPVAAKGPDDDPNADPSPDVSPSQEPVSLADTVLDPWMQEVLDGDRTFRSSYNEEQEFTIHQISTFYYGEPVNMTVKAGKLAILDLDRDGINEMVIYPVREPADDSEEIVFQVGYLILRRTGDEVCGYAPGWRSVSRLKADGTFEWAGSAFDGGTGSARFTENGFEINQITWCGNGVDKENYFVDGLSATREEFDAAYDAQRFKPDPAWYTYADGVLAPWLPDNLELVGQTDPASDTGGAKLWLEGGESPWLEWNGSTHRLNGVVTRAQAPGVNCRDFDGDGENEVVFSYYFNGFLQLDLYEWNGSQPVFTATYDTQQLLLRFNQNNVAAYNKDTRELTVTYSHTEGSMDDPDYYRHLVMGHALVPEDFFDGGYEHIRDGYPHVYANGFRQFYLGDADPFYPVSFYFEFDFYLADETMQELGYVDLGPDSWYADHYMIGTPVGETGFTLCYDGTQWRVRERNKLDMFYSGLNFPTIPLDQSLSAPVPGFLDAEQQLIYRQAYELYIRLFGFTNDNAVDFWPEAGGNLLPPAEAVQRGGFTYAAARGPYGVWDDFERAVLSVFTRKSWDAKNTFDDNGNAIYINVGDRMYYFNYGRGGGNYNGNFPETFRLVERTDNTISFIMTGYYSNYYPLEGETDAERNARVATNWEYSIDFPMRMVKTADGWRFDEFHLAITDGGEPFYSRRVPNPNAPAAATGTPEPSSEPSPTPTACEHGLDNAISGWSNGYLVFTCDLDGAACPVPAVTQGDWEPGISEDFDGDGHVEHAFFQNGLMMIVDMEAGQLVTSIFDPDSTFAAFDQGRTWEMPRDRTVLTVSYLDRTVQVPLSFSAAPFYPDAVIARPLTPEKIYPYTGYVFRGDHFDMSAPVDLGKVNTDSVSLVVHWNVRYTGGGFQVISDSFQFELVPW